MSLNAAALKLMAEKGLSALDIVEIAEALECAEPRSTGAIRQARYRQNKRGRDASCDVTSDVTRDASPTPPIEDILTPGEVKEADASSPHPAPRPWALPVGVSLQVWTDFLGNRKRKRLGNTPTAWKGFCDDLKRIANQTGIPPPKLIEHAAKKGWGSINTPDEDQGHGQQRTNGMAGHQPDGLSPTTRAAARIFGTAPASQPRTVPG